MNYLAHAYLSFHFPEIVVGNMISDSVKGKTKFSYPLQIQNGIALHRAIDEFTDAHPATKKAKEFFRPYYRLYSGAFIDVVYDHFLAQDKNEFENAATLKKFSTDTYAILDENFSLLPVVFQNMLPYMKEHDWLFNYQHLYGIERSFGGLVKRAAYLTESATAFKIFNENYSALKDCYNIFFPSVKKFALQYLHEMLLA